MRLDLFQGVCYKTENNAGRNSMPAETNRESLQTGDPRLIVRWAQRYARSRTISFLVQWVFIVTMVMIIGIAATLTNKTYRPESMGLFYLCIVSMVLSILAMTWFSVSKWGGEVIWRITQWLYGDEGYAAYLGDRHDGPTPWWVTALGGGLVVYHLVGAILVSFRILPLAYMQPFSAAYMAPFLALMILYQRLGFWAWIWPIFYAAHGVMMVMGLPIGFPGQWQLLDMAVPVFGYGLIAILTGHVYSRFALQQLKRLTRDGLIDAPAEEDDALPRQGDESAGSGGQPL